MKEPKFKVSIITINLNNKEGLRKTIDSIINQTFKKIEFIIIDGASTDSSVDVIKQFESKISYWTSEPDNGIYEAMNKGINIATGDYCLFLNSGDFLVDNYVIFNVLNTKPVEYILYGGIINDLENYKQEVHYPNEQYITFRHFLISTLPHPSSFIKRNLFDLIGRYNERLKIVADWEFFLLAICKYNVTIKKLNFPISVFNTSGISSTIEFKKTSEMERNEVLQLHFSRYLEDYNYLEKLEHNKPIQFITFYRKWKQKIFKWTH